MIITPSHRAISRRYRDSSQPQSSSSSLRFVLKPVDVLIVPWQEAIKAMVVPTRHGAAVEV